MTSGNSSALRPRLRWVSVLGLVLAGLLAAVSVLSGRAAAGVADSVLEQNWRGSYDLLVTAPGLGDELSPGEDLSGLKLLDPNFANTKAPTMSMETVDAVGETDGVEFAAPIGYLGSVAGAMDYTWIYIPWVDLEERPEQKLDINWRAVGHDGLGERIVMDYYERQYFDVSGWNGRFGIEGIEEWSLERAGVEARLLSTTQLTSQGVIEPAGFSFSWWPVPMLNSTIFAVDPVAEIDLLGVDGEFLKPLIDFREVTEEFGEVTTAKLLPEIWTDEFWHRAKHEDVWTLDPSIPLHAALEHFPGTRFGNRPAIWGSFGYENPFIGYLRNEKAFPPTRLEVNFIRHEGDEKIDLGTSVLDLGERFKPFNGANLAVMLPDTKGSIPVTQEVYVFPPQHITFGISPLELVKLDADDVRGGGVPNPQLPAFEVVPQGIEQAVPRMAFERPNGRWFGQEQTYRQGAGMKLQVGGNVADKDLPGPAPFEVGTYVPRSLDDGDAAYVPLGAYDVAEVRVLDSGAVLNPARQSLGLAAQPASAIVSLEGASLMTENDFVNAVRVRVSGLDGLSREAALGRIGTVADGLVELGVDVYVVAGSSLQAVQLWVPGYAFGTMDPDGSQRVGDLGWVEQDFTTLGASSWSAQVTGSSLMGLTFVGLVIAGAAVFGLAVLARPERRVTHALLFSQGWSAGQRFGWTLREELPGLITAGALLVLSLVLAGSWPVAGGVLGVALAVLIGIWVSNPLRARGDGEAGLVGTRAGLLWLCVGEGVVVGVVSVCVGVLVEIVLWFSAVSERTRISQGVLDALRPVSIMFVLAVVLLAVLFRAIFGVSDPIHKRRSTFKYWQLNQPLNQVHTGRFGSVITTLFTAAAVITASVLIAPSTGFSTQGLATSAAATTAIWFLARTHWAYNWKPAG